MTHVNKIKILESASSGMSVFLFKGNGTEDGRWFAYGYSAFILKDIVSVAAVFPDSLLIPVLEISTSDHPVVCETFHFVEETPEWLRADNPDGIDRDAYHTWVRSLSGVAPFLPANPIPSYTMADGMSPSSRRLKRLFDILASALFLLVLSPVFLICSVVLLIINRGKVFYSQIRLGRNGQPFRLYKFRSMKKGVEEMGPTLSDPSKGPDPRLTGFGEFIRSHHLDELPQLVNVLKGEMSIVGPRPERPFYVEQLMEKDPRYVNLFQLRPGLASYSYLKHGYADNLEKMLERMETDLYYLEHRSLGLDLLTLLQTPPLLFRLPGGKE